MPVLEKQGEIRVEAEKRYLVLLRLRAEYQEKEDVVRGDLKIPRNLFPEVEGGTASWVEEEAIGSRLLKD